MESNLPETLEEITLWKLANSGYDKSFRQRHFENYSRPDYEFEQQDQLILDWYARMVDTYPDLTDRCPNDLYCDRVMFAGVFVALDYPK